MGRRATGEIKTHRRKDGTNTYSLRVRALGDRWTLPLGNELDGWSDKRAALELENTLKKVEAGVWRPPVPLVGGDRDPSFHQYASHWLAQVEPLLKPKTYKRYRWMLVSHLLPEFASRRLSEITSKRVDNYRRRKVLERQEIDRTRAAGASLKGPNGAPLRGLSPSSVNESIDLLARILDDAIEELENAAIATNPARGRRRKLKVAKRKGNHLEADEVEDLIDAAGQLDRPLSRPRTDQLAANIVQLRDGTKLAWKAVAVRLGTSVGYAHYLYSGLKHRTETPKPSVRRAIVAALVSSGLRNSELCALNWEDTDFPHRKIAVRDAKTPTGVRFVDMTPRLVEELLRYRSGLAAVEASKPAFATRTGGRRNADNVNARVLRPAVRRANETRAGRRAPSLPPRVTPHTLRRTYITLMFEAGASVPYAMSQVGHADSATTLEIYSQVLKRRERRTVGEAFDRLMRDAVPSGSDGRIGGPTMGSDDEKSTKFAADQLVFGPQSAPPGPNGPNRTTVND
jgi:integrase